MAARRAWIGENAAIDEAISVRHWIERHALHGARWALRGVARKTADRVDLRTEQTVRELLEIRQRSECHGMNFVGSEPSEAHIVSDPNSQ